MMSKKRNKLQCPKVTPLTRFRVYPDKKKSLYFIVQIWKNKKQMQLGTPQTGRKAEASCTTQEWRIEGKLQQQCGTINFNNKYLTEEVIAHEMTHAAVSWARRTKLDVSFFKHYVSETEKRNPRMKSTETPEEVLCYAIGDLVQQFCNRYRKTGLYDE